MNDLRKDLYEKVVAWHRAPMSIRNRLSLKVCSRLGRVWYHRIATINPRTIHTGYVKSLDHPRFGIQFLRSFLNTDVSRVTRNSIYSITSKVLE